MNKKGKQIQKKHEKRKQLSTKATGLKWVAIAAGVAVIIIGIVSLIDESPSTAEPRKVNEVEMQHAHGMGYSTDGSKLLFAVHDGLRIYEKGQWVVPAGKPHDYMGFSMSDDGFYSSGHPAPGSSEKSPLGIVKSIDEGKSLEPLALYGQVDFHGMSVGYKSHAIYVFNPQPNAKMKTTGLHYSTDEANSWTKSEAKGLEGEPVALAVHPSDEAIVAVGTDRGVFVSKDFGQQFEKIGADMQATSLFFHPKGALYAGGVNRKVNLSRIDLEPEQQENINIPSITEDAIAFIAQNPINDQELAFMTFNKDVYISSDYGKSWVKIADQGKGKSGEI